MFKGEHWCALDEKGRLNFPAKFREEMGPAFTITRWLENCLVAFPAEQWDRIEKLLATGTITQGIDVKRKLYGGATDVTMDKQGRVLIPPELRRRAGLKKDVVVIGVGQVVEIWDADTLDDFDESVPNNEIANAMRELGI